MITAAQLDVLFEYPRPITEAEAEAFNAIAAELAPAPDDGGATDVEAIRPWLASLGIVGPPPRVGTLARRLAAAARRMAARG